MFEENLYDFFLFATELLRVEFFKRRERTRDTPAFVRLSVCRNVSVKLRIFFLFYFFFHFFFQQGRRAKRFFGKYFLLKIGIFILVQRYLYAPIATAAYASRKKQLSSKYVFLKKDLPLKRREVSPQIQMINLLKKRFVNNLFFLLIYFNLLF